MNTHIRPVMTHANGLTVCDYSHNGPVVAVETSDETIKILFENDAYAKLRFAFSSARNWFTASDLSRQLVGHTIKIHMETKGIEPPTSWSTTKRVTVIGQIVFSFNNMEARVSVFNESKVYYTVWVNVMTRIDWVRRTDAYLTPLRGLMLNLDSIIEGYSPKSDNTEHIFSLKCVVQQPDAPWVWKDASYNPPIPSWS
jgi:hypothetical protein